MRKKGFTLVELLVVIAIIGLLSTLAIVALNSARQKSRDAKRVADIKQIQTALELYFNDQNAYPSGTTLAIGEGNGILDCGSGLAECDKLSATDGISNTAAGTTYMALIPRDPSAATTGTPPECASGSTAVCHYSYSVADVGSGTSNGYEIWFLLEANTGSLVSGINCATEAGISSVSCTH